LTKAKVAKSGRALQNATMNMTSRVLGGLDCQIIDMIDSDRKPQLVVVVCHGFGATGTDLVPIGGELLQRSSLLAEQVRFIFPAAPLAPEEFGMFGGRAWWMLDIERMNSMIAEGRLRDLRNEHPDGLDEARSMLLSLIDEVRAETGLPMSQFVLAGFSQGSMLSTDVTLRLAEPPAALCIWSGTLLCESVWRDLAARRGPLKVLQSHGRQDPILPFEGAIWLREMLEESGSKVDFIEFQGEHTIPTEALQKTLELLHNVLSDISDAG
jgi:phospholipase/carboxylesterase